MSNLFRFCFLIVASAAFIGTCMAASTPSHHTFSNINQVGGWENCDSCAGRNGRGAHVPHRMTEHLHSPSIDGQAAEFWLGSHRYTAALWWKQLGAQPNASHFTYDFYFYMTNPNAVQALEFDFNQSVAGHKFIFGHECSPRGSHQWDIWDGAHHRWVPSGVACQAPKAFQWHHIIFAAERVGAKTHFISVTLDGHTSYFNRYFNAFNSHGHELNVAVQLDNNSHGESYSLWADQINFNYW